LSKFNFISNQKGEEIKSFKPKKTNDIIKGFRFADSQNDIGDKDESFDDSDLNIKFPDEKENLLFVITI
jgi:hypothetical protein